MAVILETGMEAKALVLVEVKIAPLFVVVVAQTEISLCEYLFCTIVAVEDFDELVFVYGVSGAVVEPDGELFPVEFMADYLQQQHSPTLTVQPNLSSVLPHWIDVSVS